MAKKETAVVAAETPVVAEKYKSAPTEEIIEYVISALEEVIVQRGKEAREYTIKSFWEVGKELRKAEKDHKVNITALVEAVVRDNRISGRQMGQRNLWMALKVYDWKPVFEEIYETEHGENISLSKIKRLLTTPRPKREPTVDEIALTLYEKLGPEKTEKLIKALQKLI